MNSKDADLILSLQYVDDVGAEWCGCGRAGERGGGNRENEERERDRKTTRRGRDVLKGKLFKEGKKLSYINDL